MPEARIIWLATGAIKRSVQHAFRGDDPYSVCGMLRRKYGLKPLAMETRCEMCRKFTSGGSDA